MSNASPPAWAIRTEADRRALAEGCFWDAKQAERIIRFAETYVSQKYGAEDAFRLFAWQKRFLGSLYGWRKPDGHRRFSLALLHVPKKNGKTLLVSVIAAYELFAAGVTAPLVVSASTTKDNAKQVYEQLCSTINGNAKLRSLAKPVDFRRIIKIPDRDAEYRALSADAPSSEGLNCSAVIVDEAHAHRSPKLWRTLEYATIGRADGLTVVISTAGDDLTHWYYDLVVRGRNILAGTDTDPSVYAEIYEAPAEGADLDCPEVWKACNPSLDLYEGFTLAKFRELWERAKKDTASRLSFERYRLNIFRRAEEGVWIQLERWDACKGEVPEAELLKWPCWLAFDGSQTTDPSTVAAVWQLPGPRYFAKAWAWVAERGVRFREATNLPRYQQFAADGCLTITEGDLIDRKAIREHILGIRSAGHQVRMVVMDATGFQVFGSELAAEGFEVFRQPQNFKHFTEATKAFDEAVTGKTVTQDGNPWLRWCIHSVRLKQDEFDNVRPSRKKSVDKIDAAVAALMAFGQAHLATAPDPKSDGPPTAFLV